MSCVRLEMRNEELSLCKTRSERGKSVSSRGRSSAFSNLPDLDLAEIRTERSDKWSVPHVPVTGDYSDKNLKTFHFHPKFFMANFIKVSKNFQKLSFHFLGTVF